MLGNVSIYVMRIQFEFGQIFHHVQSFTGDTRQITHMIIPVTLELNETLETTSKGLIDLRVNKRF